MFRMALGKASRNVPPSSRMNPARHTRVTPRARSSRTRTCSKASREGKSRCGIVRASMPARRARSSPAASARLAMTSAIRARSRPSPTASMSACRLLPRPEMRTPTLGSDPMAALTGSFWGLTPFGARSGRYNGGKRLACAFITVARKRRIAPGGFVYHVCNRGSRKGVIAETYDEYCEVLALIERARAKIGMRIIAYNILNNHFHFLLWPVCDSDLSRFMKAFEQPHAQRFHRRRQTRGCGAVYQSRFVNRMIRDERSYFTALRYVEANARRHGVVQRAEAWPWCSAWQSEPVGPAVVLADSPIPRPENWLEILNED